MPKLTNISGREAVKAFVKAGYTHARTAGDHAILTKPGFHTLSIPLYKEVKPFLLKSQIKRAKLTDDEFLKLVRGKVLGSELVARTMERFPNG